MMVVEYDADADAAYIYAKHPLKKGDVVETLTLSENVNIDFGKDNELLGVEVLKAKTTLGSKILETR